MHRLSRRDAALAIAGAAALPLVPSVARAAVAANEVRAIAQAAYVYGFPMVDFYRILWGYFADTGGPQYVAPMGQIYNTARVYGPGDTTVQTPNSDTPYSFALIDLRAEPSVITLPPIESTRYYSVQLVDLYTYNSGYLGTRTDGNGGGNFLISGPSWKGATPEGVRDGVASDTDFMLALFRTQVFDAADLPTVKEIQAGYKLAPLSSFAGGAASTPPPAVSWIAPLSPIQERSSLGFFNILAWMLQYCPPFPDEVALRARFASIGVKPGVTFDPTALGAIARDALTDGMNAGQKQIDAARAKMTSSASLFGSRRQIGDNYLERAIGAQVGILGNTAEEAMYFPYETDATHQPLDGRKTYTITFAAGQLPPVHAFWSLTMYNLPEQLLVENKLQRYLINSPMLPHLKKGADGSITLYLSSVSPGKDKESNWLPAPEDRFFAILRCYLPDKAVLDDSWKPPAAIAQ